MSSLQLVQPGASDWDAFVASRPDAHILQTSAWGELKSRFGWSAERIVLRRDGRIVAGALVLFRRLPLRLGTLAYIPKGPIIDLADAELTAALIDSLDRLARSRRAILLKIEPDALAFSLPGFRPSSHIIQPPRTIVIDIARSEDDILAAMHPKTRYNIRLASKKGVSVRAATQADLPAFNALMQATGARDGFAVHSPAYYTAAFDLFAPRDAPGDESPGYAMAPRERGFQPDLSGAIRSPKIDLRANPDLIGGAGIASLFVAEVESQIVAGLFAFGHGERAWYFYGASGEAHRDKMPNHALQWRAIQWARSIGCREYDLWGIPDEDEAALEAQYLNRSDGLWGVYRFKRGFGGRVVRFAGAFDRVYNSLLYWLYLLAMRNRE